MTATKVNEEINDEGIRKLFEEKNLVFLATLMKDGSPQNVSTWVDIEDGTILTNTVSGGTKHKNISHDPRVALAITDQNNLFHTVSIREKVIELIVVMRPINILINWQKSILVLMNIQAENYIQHKKGWYWRLNPKRYFMQTISVNIA